MTTSKQEAGKLGYAKVKGKLLAYAQSKADTAITRYNLEPKFCKGCKSPIPYSKRDNVFCGHSCSASWTNRSRPTREKKTRSCKRCSSPCSRRSSHCSPCWDYLQRVGGSPRAFPFERCTSDRSRKRVLLLERGHKCEGCGLSEWQGQPIPIQLDHINGRSDCNTRENLRLLCPNCHAQTPTFGALNKGNADSARNLKRRDRYRQS